MMKYLNISDRSQIRKNDNDSNIHVIFLGLLLVSLLVLTGCKKDETKETDYSATKAKMTKVIQEHMKKYDMTGVSIALVDGDAKKPVVWSQGFGFADKENNIPVTPSTVFRAGSISKLFTGMAIMQLAEQGKIDIEKPLQNYLPNLKINSHFKSTAPVTIRNMLTHHSGLPSNELKSMWGDATADASDILKKPYDLASPPNTQYAYSNLAFGLLGQVIENVSGVSYEDYVKQKLLAPMGMSESYMDHTLVDKANHAKGYFGNKNYPIVHLRDVAAGGLNSTVLDLAKFAQMTFPRQSTKVLSNASLESMRSPQFTSHSPFVDNSLGLAWGLSDDFDKRSKGRAGMIAGHDGGTALFSSEFIMLSKHKLAVVVMTNGSNDAGSGTSAIAHELLQMALKAKTKVSIEPEPTFQLPPVVPTTEDALSNMPGMWLGQKMNLLLKKVDNRLLWNINDTDIPLVNRGNDTYYLDYKSAGLSAEQVGVYATLGLKYLKNADTQAIEITQSNTRIDFAEKLKPQQVSDVWKNRLGKYQLISTSETLPLFSVVQLDYDSDILIIQGQSKQFYGKESPFTFAFDVLNNQKAVQYGVGRNTGYALTFKTAPDGTERMYMSGYEFKKIS